MTFTSAAERHPFHLVDTIVSREGPNSPWVRVEFVGEGGETVTVRLPFSVAYPDEAGRSRMVGRAMQLMKKIVATGGEVEIPLPRTGRFGIPEPDI